MKAILFGLCVMLTAGVAGAQVPTNIKIKPGLWEVRILKMEQDGRDLMPGMRQAVANIPPEYLEQLSKMGVGAGLVGNDVVLSRVCYSAAMVKNNDWLAEQYKKQQQECSPPIVKHGSGNRSTFEIICKNTTIKGEGVITDDLITTKSEIMTIVNRKMSTVVQESQMTFLSSDCGDIKP